MPLTRNGRRRSARSRSAMTRSSVVLPQPGRADQRDEIALADLQIDVGEGLHLAVARLEGQRHAAGVDRQWASTRRGAAFALGALRRTHALHGAGRRGCRRCESQVVLRWARRDSCARPINKILADPRRRIRAQPLFNGGRILGMPFTAASLTWASQHVSLGERKRRTFLQVLSAWLEAWILT